MRMSHVLLQPFRMFQITIKRNSAISKCSRNAPFSETFVKSEFSKFLQPSAAPFGLWWASRFCRMYHADRVFLIVDASWMRSF